MCRRRKSPSSSPNRKKTPSKAPATTTVGSTNGTVTSPRIQCRYLPRRRVTRAAAGKATTSVIAVEANACHTVNHTTPRVRDEPNKSDIALFPSAPRPRHMIAATG